MNYGVSYRRCCSFCSIPLILCWGYNYTYIGLLGLTSVSVIYSDLFFIFSSFISDSLSVYLSPAFGISVFPNSFYFGVTSSLVYISWYPFLFFPPFFQYNFHIPLYFSSLTLELFTQSCKGVEVFFLSYLQAKNLASHSFKDQT